MASKRITKELQVRVTKCLGCFGHPIAIEMRHSSRFPGIGGSRAKHSPRCHIAVVCV
ncbi:hypothetical protein N9L76_06835 [bacterium]|nr:hypothetical protein [bacterium]